MPNPTVRSKPTLPIFFTALPFASLFNRSLFSYAHSLLTAVAKLRAARGDVAGAARATTLADKLEFGFGFGFWRIALDYAWRWRDLPLAEIHGDVNKLLTGLTELIHLKSPPERSEWGSRNLKIMRTLYTSLVHQLLRVFGHSGGVREAVELMQIELFEGGLIKDCLELGGNDLRAFIKVVQDLMMQFSQKDVPERKSSEKHREL